MPEFSIEIQIADNDGNFSKNHNLPTISSCALKNVKVTYGPDGMFNAFKNSGGMPTETTMELQFVELETLTRERLMEMEPTQEEVVTARPPDWTCSTSRHSLHNV